MHIPWRFSWFVPVSAVIGFDKLEVGCWLPSSWSGTIIQVSLRASWGCCSTYFSPLCFFPKGISVFVIAAIIWQASCFWKNISSFLSMHIPWRFSWFVPVSAVAVIGFDKLEIGFWLTSSWSGTIVQVSLRASRGSCSMYFSSLCFFPKGISVLLHFFGSISWCFCSPPILLSSISWAPLLCFLLLRDDKKRGHCWCGSASNKELLLIPATYVSSDVHRWCNVGGISFLKGNIVTINNMQQNNINVVVILHLLCVGIISRHDDISQQPEATHASDIWGFIEDFPLLAVSLYSSISLCLLLVMKFVIGSVLIFFAFLFLLLPLNSFCFSFR